MITFSLSASAPQSGKDTLAQLLVKHYEAQGKTCKVIAFGDALRSHVASLFGPENYAKCLKMLNSSEKDIPMNEFALSMVDSYSHEYSSYMMANKGLDVLEPRSLRFHMQRYGTDYVREYKGLEDWWCDIVVSALNHYKRLGIDVAIVTDTRFPIEFYKMRNYFNAKFIKVDAIGFPESLYVKSGDKHKAESYADEWDYDFKVYNQFGFHSLMLDTLIENPEFPQL